MTDVDKRDHDPELPVLTERVPDDGPTPAAHEAGDDDLPRLTEVAAAKGRVPETGLREQPGDGVDEAQLARLHSELTAATFQLTEELLRAAWSSAEARLFAHVLERLRQELPELVEQVVREQLGRRNPGDDAS